MVQTVQVNATLNNTGSVNNTVNRVDVNATLNNTGPARNMVIELTPEQQRLQVELNPENQQPNPVGRRGIHVLTPLRGNASARYFDMHGEARGAVEAAFNRLKQQLMRDNVIERNATQVSFNLSRDIVTYKLEGRSCTKNIAEIARDEDSPNHAAYEALVNAVTPVYGSALPRKHFEPNSKTAENCDKALQRPQYALSRLPSEYANAAQSALGLYENSKNPTEDQKNAAVKGVTAVEKVLKSLSDKITAKINDINAAGNPLTAEAQRQIDSLTQAQKKIEVNRFALYLAIAFSQSITNKNVQEIAAMAKEVKDLIQALHDEWQKNTNEQARRFPSVTWLPDFIRGQAGNMPADRDYPGDAAALLFALLPDVGERRLGYLDFCAEQRLNQKADCLEEELLRAVNAGRNLDATEMRQFYQIVELISPTTAAELQQEMLGVLTDADATHLPAGDLQAKVTAFGQAHGVIANNPAPLAN